MENDNLIFFNYILSKSDLIYKVCLPAIEYLAIDAFAYIKINKDGTYFGYNTDVSWCKYYLQNVRINRTYIINPYENKLNISRWPIYNPQSAFSSILKAYYERGFLDGIDICKQTDEILESWTFITRDRKNGVMDYYQKYPYYLKQFISYFDAELYKITSKSSKQPLAQFIDGANFYKEKQVKRNINTEKFLNFIRESHREINVNNKLIHFTEREHECLYLMAQGYTATKELAKILKISPRTAEHFVNNIKFKTGCNYKSDIIKCFLESLDIYNININDLYLLKPKKVFSSIS